MSGKVFLKTWGCQMNISDSEVICGILKQAGYSLVDEPKKADIIIFNTCSVRQHAEDKFWSEVGRYKSQTKPIIGVIGCMAQNYKDAIFQRAPQVDFVVGPSDIDKIPQIVNRLTKSPDCPVGRQGHEVGGQNLTEIKIWETDGYIRAEEIYHTGFHQDKEHAYVVISEGCSNFCSYCVVPYVRGSLHNRNQEDIIREIEEVVEKGINKVTLLGQNVNAYRSTVHSVHQSTVGFIELLKLINNIKGLQEFSFITSHPKDTSLDLFKAMAELEKLKKYLHLPVQSGSDSILKMMNRAYTRKFYLDLAANYRKIVEGGTLTTDIIVGFPGEKEEDFKDTYGLVKDIQFEGAYIFKYSTRPNTEAAKLVDDVAQEEKERRHGLILELQKSISKKKRC
jgi:tRNA-2-methylthio-N6-dimethylallyladenosine synthase